MIQHALLVALLSANGVPQNGFPNWEERTLLVLTNRARADPAMALASCASSDCPDATCYAPGTPYVWSYDLNRSARFHMANLVDSAAPLQHPSPCLLVSTIGTDYPANCDGSPSCACQGGTSICDCSGCGTCNLNDPNETCVTTPGARGALFTPYWQGENIAAGYGDPLASMEGWLTEACTWTQTCGFQNCTAGENGHRYNILNQDFGYQMMGGGSVQASGASACYPNEWDCQDFGGGSNPTVPELVAGTHYPNDGSTGLTFWVNWFDDQPPTSAVLNVDGACHSMTVDRGSGGNATYAWNGSVTNGCHSYVFVFTDHTGLVSQLPEVGAYQVGGSCSADYVTDAPAGCGVVTNGTTSSTGSSTTSSSGGNTSGGGTTGGGYMGGAGIGTAGGTIGGLTDVSLPSSSASADGGGSAKSGGCASGGPGGEGLAMPLLAAGLRWLARRRKSPVV